MAYLGVLAVSPAGIGCADFAQQLLWREDPELLFDSKNAQERQERKELQLKIQNAFCSFFAFLAYLGVLGVSPAGIGCADFAQQVLWREDPELLFDAKNAQERQERKELRLKIQNAFCSFFAFLAYLGVLGVSPAGIGCADFAQQLLWREDPELLFDAKNAQERQERKELQLKIQNAFVVSLRSWRTLAFLALAPQGMGARTLHSNCSWR